MGRLHSYEKTYTRALAGVQENGMADDRNWLVDHTGIGVSEIFRSAKFYEAALRPLGIEALVRIARNFKRIDKDGPDLGGVGFGIDYPVFWVDVFPSSNTAFRALRRQQVNDFHAAAIPVLRRCGRPRVS